MSKHTNFIKAMTLAEVMITLAVIGVIGAIVIPSFIQNYQKHAYVSALKKTYLTLSLAGKQLAHDNGGKVDGAWNNSYNDGWSNILFKITMAKYLDMKVGGNECKSVCDPRTGGNCNGSTCKTTNWGIWPKFARPYGGCSDLYCWTGSDAQLSDGALLYFMGNSDSYNNWQPHQCNDAEFKTNDKCGTIIVDINGSKAPNVWGRDIFSFRLRANGEITPRGSKLYSNSPGSCNGEDNADCAARIIEDSWQMNY